jgi:hypothetical protein
VVTVRERMVSKQSIDLVKPRSEPRPLLVEALPVTALGLCLCVVLYKSWLGLNFMPTQFLDISYTAFSMKIKECTFRKNYAIIERD